MKAVIFEKFGIENLKVGNVDDPDVPEGYVLVRSIQATLNPIDLFAIEGKRKVSPLPHIPGVELYGEVVDGYNKDIRKGAKIIVYPRLFCGKCIFCFSEREMICTGELFGVSSQGGFAELCIVPARNIFEIPDSIPPEVASSLPVGALTAFHALSFAEAGNKVAVVGATGHTGIFSVQIAKLKGCEVIAISRKKNVKWLLEFGADEIVSFDQIHRFREYCDLVIDPLGSQTFSESINLVRKGGKFVTFGIMTGGDAYVNLFDIYSKHISICGVTGGSRNELYKLIELAKKGSIRTKVWKEFKLEDIHMALRELKNPMREGKISIVIGN